MTAPEDLGGALLCRYPAYLGALGLGVALGVTVVVQISYLVKTAVLTALLTFYALVPSVILTQAYLSYDGLSFIKGISTQRAVSNRYADPVMCVIVWQILILICRQFDFLRRKLYYYQWEVSEMRHQLHALSDKNDRLIYNILPAYVASDFIGSNKRDEELYAHGFEEVGVLFASCPNFNDFYTEDAVNNNGLECIRFLNEILSDYDDLLADQRFKSIIKIKSIGSTYMAASGMDNSEQQDQNSEVKERWRHLADLLEFGLAMKETLNKINSQSFNNFMLRIGINHGPVIAGVIGARKPHYDIWGNSVNVASRMESTGQVGKVQVVEPTMRILSEFGYKFEQRGMVTVKGKGQMMTYFLLTKDTSKRPLLPHHVSD